MLLQDIVDNFELLDEPEDRYRYLIELGRELEPLSEAAHNDHNRVRGCASQVWVETTVERGNGEPILTLRGDSDAHIVKGLVKLVLAFYSGKSAIDIIAQDPQPLFEKLGLASHLTRQRTNGVRSMVERIKSDARAASGAA